MPRERAISTYSRDIPESVTIASKSDNVANKDGVTRPSLPESTTRIRDLRGLDGGFLQLSLCCITTGDPERVADAASGKEGLMSPEAPYEGNPLGAFADERVASERSARENRGDL